MGLIEFLTEFLAVRFGILAEQAHCPFIFSGGKLFKIDVMFFQETIKVR